MTKILSTKSFAIFYRLHTVIGLFIALHCLVLFATGAILIFKDEIQDFSRPKISPVEKTTGLGAPRSDLYDFILQQALQDHPNDRPLSLFPDEEDSSTLNLRLGIDGTKQFRGARRLAFDSVTGLPKEAKHSESGFFAWTLRLHREIFLGSWGKIYVGFIGLLYLFTLISGFIIYGNFMKKTAYAEIRRQSARGFFSEMHRFTGVSIIAWSLLVGFTGMLLAFNSSLIKIYQYTELQKLNEQYKTSTILPELASLDQVIATVRKAKPDSKVSFVAFPDTQFSIPNHFIVLVRGGEGFAQNLSELVVVNAQSAELVEVRTLPVYLKMLMLSEPLHFGNYGGVVLKVVWLLFALVSIVMPVSGILIFNKRRRRQKADRLAAGEIVPTKSLFAFTKNAYVWPLVMILISAGAMSLPLLTLGYMPWIASLICAVPAMLVAVILLRRLRKARPV